MTPIMWVLLGAVVAFALSYISLCIAEKIDTKKQLKTYDSGFVVYCWDSIDNALRIFDALIDTGKKYFQTTCSIAETDDGMVAIFIKDGNIVNKIQLIDATLKGAKLVNSCAHWYVDETMPTSRFLEIIEQDGYEINAGRDITSFTDATEIRTEERKKKDGKS